MNTKYKSDFTLIGKRIANARKLSGMTQEQLAHSIGFGVNHLSEIERGISGISVGKLMGLVKILNVSADYILFGKDTTDSPLNIRLKQILPAQKQYMEEMLNLFINCCLDKNCFAPQVEIICADEENNKLEA